MTDYDRPSCAACHCTLWNDEQHRLACRPCERRIASHLEELPKLIVELRGFLVPTSRASGPRVTASKEPPAPINLHVLDHITKTTATLDSWLCDWHDHLGWTPPSYRADPLSEATNALRTNLPWAAEHHPAIADFITEIHDLHRSTAGLLDPATWPRRVGTCPTTLDADHTCGAPLRYVVGAASIACGWCGAAWDPLDLAAHIQGYGTQ